MQPLTKIDRRQDRQLRNGPASAEMLEAIAKLGETMAAGNVAQTSFDNQPARLAKRGLIELREEGSERDPHPESSLLRRPILNSTGASSRAEQITARWLRPETAKPFAAWCHGSGKPKSIAGNSELRSVGKARSFSSGNFAHPQTVERFKSRFARRTKWCGAAQPIYRRRAPRRWHKILLGRARIVIGARSAVFAPLKDLGLIIVDEDTRRLTSRRRRSLSCARRAVCAARSRMARVLGSAPVARELFTTSTTGKYELLTLTQRVDDQRRPLMRIVDLRRNARKEKDLIRFFPRNCVASDRGSSRKARADDFILIGADFRPCSAVCRSRREIARNCSVALTSIAHGTIELPPLRTHRDGAEKCPACGKTRSFTQASARRKSSPPFPPFSKANVRRMDAIR